MSTANLMSHKIAIRLGAASMALLLIACGGESTSPSADRSSAATASTTSPASARYFGTLEPWAAESIYFVVTDRFVNGDPSNDQREQGGKHPSFGLARTCEDGTIDNIGYLGGDFKGLLQHAGYIRDMGFSAVWITPIVDNPDQAFSGGDPITCSSFLTDRGKAGYHGYWGTNFFTVDEHLESSDLRFADLTRALRQQGLKTVLDIVANHTSPGFTMPEPQPGFGQLFDADGALLADHQNLPPEQLDPNNPLHQYYNRKRDLAQLADLDGSNPKVRDYLLRAYLQWIEQGAAAFRIDTIRHQSPEFWADFSTQIRARHPGFFMFGEAFDYEAKNIASFTWPKSGAVSVLDFPLKKAMSEVFEKGASFELMAAQLFLEKGPYRNPYELTTFYDNHDMARMNASDEGFIDAHHWLFTARGIPVIYYGSEIGFMRGRVEHHGNRNYFGGENIELAKTHKIHAALKQIARARAASVALQKGLMLVDSMRGDHAVFFRVFAHEGTLETALVMLNKSATTAALKPGQHLETGRWRDLISGAEMELSPEQGIEVPAHGARVFVRASVNQNPATIAALDALMRGKDGVEAPEPKEPRT
jgi:cyclomaltodextrin glucanotransferase